MGYQSKLLTFACFNVSKNACDCAGWILITKRLGALAGVALRQLLIKSVRNNTNNAKANKPTAKALTCTMAYAGRALICRVANINQAGDLPSVTQLRNNFTANQAMPANTNTAPAKPPTTIKPNFKSRLATTNKTAKPNKPIALTTQVTAFGSPISRRMTRKAGTLASCNTGGNPKANNKVSPVANP